MIIHVFYCIYVFCWCIEDMVCEKCTEWKASRYGIDVLHVVVTIRFFCRFELCFLQPSCVYTFPLSTTMKKFVQNLNYFNGLKACSLF